MRVYFIRKNYFTFQGQKSYQLEILGKSILQLMQERLRAEESVFEERENFTEGIYLYTAFPFAERVPLERWACAKEGSFAFSGGFVLRNGDTCNNLPVFPAPKWLGRPVYTLSDYSCAKKFASRVRAKKLLYEGVMVENGAEIDYDCKIGEGTSVGKNVRMQGACVIGKNVRIGDGCNLSDCTVGDDTQIEYSTLIETNVGTRCTVGPYAYLRPFSRIGDRCRIGDFVEVKNATVGDECKIAHLSYVGDAELGARVNVGCGTVFANYDGKNKYRSTVGDDCFLGCNSNLIAPVKVGNRSFIAAGTTLTQDLQEDDFCVGREKETIKRGGAKKYLSRR